jgi:hypothetical protein
VSLYTGVPDISIPLFTVKGRTLELPITLRYRASGVRVEEIASWVGLGWSLEAGGVITRAVRGRVDEKNTGYYHTGNVWYNNDNWPSPLSLNIIRDIHDGVVDGDPDQFFFSFAGRSGQFVMGPVDQAGTIEYRAIPSQKLRIVPTIGALNGAVAILSWEITAEDGTRYTFAAPEGHWDYTSGSQSNDGEFLTSSWHLTKIKAVSGDSILLSYAPYSARHRMGWYHEEFWDVYGNPIPPATCPGPVYDITSEYLIDPTQRLVSIQAAAHTVTFTTGGTLRSDALSPAGAAQEPRLDHITVTTPAGTVLRVFQLQHDYFPGNRLRLLSVAEQDRNGVSLPPYTFTYDGQTLPPRTSYAQDHWGYYNGRTENTTFIPTLVYQNFALPGAIRSPDAAFMKAGVLTKITYPTGGTSEFVYEGNDYGAVAFGGPMEEEFQRSASTFSAPYEGVQSTTFTVGGSSSVAAHVGVSMYVHPTQPIVNCENGDPVYPCPWTEIVGVAPPWYPGHPPYAAGSSYNTSADIVLAPGTYTLHASAAGWNVDISVVVDWKEKMVVTKKAAGGLRIAELRTTDGRGNTTVTKYQYTLQSDPARSSGVIGIEPKYDFEYSGAQCHFYSRASTSKIPLGSGTIGEVAYREVTVLHGANGEYGSTRHTFRSIVEWLDGFNTSPWPFALRTSNAWERGQPIETIEYDAAGRIQRRVKALYSVEALNPIPARRFRAMSIYTYWGGGAVGFYGNAYEVIAGWLFQSDDTTMQYDTTGTSSVALAKTFVYGNPNHLQLTEVQETNSDATKRVTRMTYPLDYTPCTGTCDAVATALTAMQGTAHIQNAVIERWILKRVGNMDSLMTAQVTTYKQYPSGQFLPYQRFVLNNPGPLP